MKKLVLVLSIASLAIPLAAFAAGPTINLVGGSVSMHPGESYVEPGYSASDPTDGNITSSVIVNNGVNSNQAGSYSVNYSVTDSLNLSDSATRSVVITSWPGFIDPCAYNHSCPCPINADIISGTHAAWKQCVMREYPKLPNGDTLVCRLKPLMPLEGDKPICAADQAGFGEMLISPAGIETLR